MTRGNGDLSRHGRPGQKETFKVLRSTGLLNGPEKNKLQKHKGEETTANEDWPMTRQFPNLDDDKMDDETMDDETLAEQLQNLANKKTEDAVGHEDSFFLNLVKMHLSNTEHLKVTKYLNLWVVKSMHLSRSSYGTSVNNHVDIK